MPGGLINTKTRLHSRVIKAVTVGDIAHLSTDFEGTTIDDSGFQACMVYLVRGLIKAWISRTTE